jgi:2-isopropylmalate synthase
LVYRSHQLVTMPDARDRERERLTLHLENNRRAETLHGAGSGPIDALVKALGLPIDVLSYEEHSRRAGSGAEAIAHVEISAGPRGTVFGVGIHANLVTASLLAVFSAVNRAIEKGTVCLPADLSRTGT